MKTIQIRIDDEIHRKAKTAAYRVGLTLADYIRAAIADKVEPVDEVQSSPDSGWRLQ